MIPDYKYENLTFSEALEYMKAGRAVTRAEWNSHEGWLNLYQSHLVLSNDCVTNETVITRHRLINDKSHSVTEISIKAKDILANDWCLVDL